MADAPAFLTKFAPILDELQDREEGSKIVAVVTMTGSCCPITDAHCMAFDCARELLLGTDERRPVAPETFGEVLGLLSLNGDKHVGEKLRMKGLPAISYWDRAELTTLATSERPWMDFNPLREPHAVQALQHRWVNLRFIRYALNGADDVCKFQKWRGCTEHRRSITMGRPGFTKQVIDGARRHGVPLDTGYFIVGPELPDISSTAVRQALQEEHGKPPEEALERLTGLLHPRVAAWLLRSEIYAKR
mmetsp:Transcript_70228/g.142160  ORF Transcript_70228/g.142160 Transcript_70228/m.142160 type:complete len:247 (-) Transcript_70228:18-758(-)